MIAITQEGREEDEQKGRRSFGTATRNPLRFGRIIIRIGKTEKTAAKHPLDDSRN